MWIVDAMLSPELPCGWLCRSCPGEEHGDEYYWNLMTGWAQWEHPQVSILTGLANDLRKRHKDHVQMEEARRKAASEASGLEDGKPAGGKFHRPSSARPK